MLKSNLNYLKGFHLTLLNQKNSKIKAVEKKSKLHLHSISQTGENALKHSHLNFIFLSQVLYLFKHVVFFLSNQCGTEN